MAYSPNGHPGAEPVGKTIPSPTLRSVGEIISPTLTQVAQEVKSQLNLAVVFTTFKALWEPKRLLYIWPDLRPNTYCPVIFLMLRLRQDASNFNLRRVF